jgi:hypothetical protein
MSLSPVVVLRGFAGEPITVSAMEDTCETVRILPSRSATRVALRLCCPSPRARHQICAPSSCCLGTTVSALHGEISALRHQTRYCKKPRTHHDSAYAVRVTSVARCICSPTRKTAAYLRRTGLRSDTQRGRLLVHSPMRDRNAQRLVVFESAPILDQEFQNWRPTCKCWPRTEVNV